MSVFLAIFILGITTILATSAHALPDLIVKTLTVDKNPIVQPDSTTIHCVIKNTGDSDATPVNYSVRVRLSSDNIYDESDTYVAGRQISIRLTPQQEREEDFNFNSGDYSSGTFYLVAKVDTTNIVTESSENNNTKYLYPFKIEPHAETISKPGTPSGEMSPIVGTTYNYSTTGATSSQGHTLQYQFDWGDGTQSSWSTSKSASHSWSSTGQKQVRVTARCQTHTDKTNISDPLQVTVVGETISKPGTPSGETSPIVGTTYTYSTTGATSSLGHARQYQFDWGDGTQSSWSTSKSASHSWSSSGQKQVRVTARCQTHTDKTNISDPLQVSVASAGSLPDLIVKTLTVDTNPIVQPQSTTVHWTIKNQGNAEATPVNYWFRVRLSADDAYDESDTYVAGRQITINLSPQEEYSSTFNFNSNDYPIGTFYLAAKIDATNIVTESSENNNTRSLPFTIEPFNGHTVQGYVKYSTGVGFGEVTVRLTGNGENLTDYTQNVGYYHFDGLANGTYTVTAEKTGWVFTNNPQIAVVNGQNVWLVDMLGSLVPPEETISKPSTPTGETSPVKNISYTYTTSGATSNLGHIVEYQFNWDDGSVSAWSTSKSGNHSWNSTGQKQIRVTARCQTHTDKTNISDPLTVTVVADELPPPTKKRLIIDTDPAVGDSDPDDGTAIIYAFQSPELCTIEGITYGYGNFGHQIPDSDRTRGANRMLDYYLLQLNKIIGVLQEAGAIDTVPPQLFYRGHKESETWDNNRNPPSNSAAEFIRDTVRDNPGQISVIALGTLTNIATAIAGYPDGSGSDPNGFMRNCRELWIIGGAIILKAGLLTGNVIDCDDAGNCAYTLAEWNIWRDKKATEYVLKHAIADPINGAPKIKMVPLNATMRWLINTNNISEVEDSNSRIANYLSFPLRWWIDEVNPWDNRQFDPNENFKIAFARFANFAKGPAFPPYDTIGMALALEPDIATWQENHKVYVDISFGTGCTVEDDSRTDREVVTVFYNYNEPNMTERIVNNWARIDFHQPPANKKFIECSGADYVVRYYSAGYNYVGPKNVSDDYDALFQYYYHLPVGVAPYYSLTDNGMYRGRLTFDVDLPDNASVTNVKLHIYCDKKKDWSDSNHRASIYYCDPQENNAVDFWNSANETNKYVDGSHIGTLQAWRTVNLGSNAVSKLQNVADGGQFAILLAEDDDDHPCAWFDTSKDWKAYLEVDFDIVNIIDFEDLAEFANYWLLNCSSPSWCNSYDFNQSGRVDFVDFALLAQKWLDIQ